MENGSTKHLITQYHSGTWLQSKNTIEGLKTKGFQVSLRVSMENVREHQSLFILFHQPTGKKNIDKHPFEFVLSVIEWIHG